MRPSIPSLIAGEGQLPEMSFLGDWLLLSPAGLLGLAAVAVPILIHLFSRSKGRRVLIGHIDLVRQSRQRRVTEIRISQWLLLVLRVLIIVVAVLILAQLARKGVETTDVDTVYVSPAWLDGASQAEWDQLSSQADSEIYLLAADYPRLDNHTFSAAAKAPDAASIESIWPLLLDRLSDISHLAEVDVYSAGLALEFGHEIPSLPRTVNWHSRESPVAYQAPQLRALIVHDADRAADANALQAALSAVRTHRLPGLRWESMETSEVTEIPAATDWLFTLSARPSDFVPLVSGKRTLTWFSDTSTAENRHSVVSSGDYPFTRFELHRAAVDLLPGTPLWLDDTGRTVLSESVTAAVRRIQFSSRLDPSWSSLVQGARFPEALLAVMMQPQQQALTFAGARVGPELLGRAERLADANMPLPNRPLQTLLALILIGLWVCERWLSERRRHAN